MGIYDINGVPVSSSLFVPLEHGDISNSGVTSNSLTNIETRFRSAFPVKVSPSSKISVTVAQNSNHVSEIIVIEYNNSMGFVRYQSYSHAVTLSSTTNYVRFAVRIDASGYNPHAIMVSGDVRIIKNFLTGTSYDRFVFEVYPGVYSSGVILLPPNYVPEGQSVPVFVYIHGSNVFSEWNSNMGEAISGVTNYPRMEYLANEGFAVLDIYGWTNKYLTVANTQNISSEPNKSNSFATPITYSSFRAGIKYAVSRYNLDENHINLYCKSLGGSLTNIFAVRDDIKVNAICELAPTIDIFFWGSFGQSVASRTIIADQLGLTGDVSSVFLQKNFDWRTTNGKTFIEANIDRFSGFNPGWDYVGDRTISQKLDDSYNKTYTRTGANREILYPVKIWVAPDDVNIPPEKIYEYVAQCQNAGKDITLRLMPENTGGHYSVDLSDDAPKSSGTTALGIAYTDVATAYVEMVDFVRSRS